VLSAERCSPLRGRPWFGDVEPEGSWNRTVPSVPSVAAKGMVAGGIALPLRVEKEFN